MSADPDDESGIVTSTVTITRTYWPDRIQDDYRDTIAVDHSSMTYLEYLGLLELAKDLRCFGTDEGDEA